MYQKDNEQKDMMLLTQGLIKMDAQEKSNLNQSLGPSNTSLQIDFTIVAKVHTHLARKII